MLDLAIVGGGIAGLAALHHAQEQARGGRHPLAARLYEAAPRLGGKVRTERIEGFLVEGGPDAFIPQKPELLELARELGLEGELLPSRDDRRRLEILSGGRLLPLPEGLQGLVPTQRGAFLRSPLLGLAGKLRALAEPLIPSRAADGRAADDESLATFVRRRFGREFHRRLAEPLLAHVYAADAERLSLAAAYPQFQSIERRWGSLTRGAREMPQPTSAAAPAPAFWTFRRGMAQLVEALGKALEPGAVQVGCEVLAIRPLEPGARSGYRLELGGERGETATTVILALPPAAAAGLVEGWAPELAERLREIRSASLATLSLGYRRENVEHPLDSFGFLVPGNASRPVLGATFTSSKFDGRAPEDCVAIRVFLGGALHPELLEREDEALIKLVEHDLGPLLGLRSEPLLQKLFRWRDGYPQYNVGHLERVARIESSCPPGLALAGNGYRGIGIADVVRSGRKAASELLAGRSSAAVSVDDELGLC